MNKIRVIVIEDHDLTRIGLVTSLQGQGKRKKNSVIIW